MPNKRTGQDYIDMDQKRKRRPPSPPPPKPPAPPAPEYKPAPSPKPKSQQKKKKRGGPDVGSGKLIKFNDKMKKILEKYPAPKRFNKKKRN